MLVLSRKINEAILVGEIRLVVVRVVGDKVKLGIEAPSTVKVLREELVEHAEK